jgi:uncharacterized tellurite resistance protein B-like protein
VRFQLELYFCTEFKAKEMSIADLYETGEQKQHKGHFRNLVMIAKADGVIEDNEMILLKKIAREISLSDANFDAILESPGKFMINPPNTKDERNERFYHLAQMVIADEGVNFSEIKKVRKFAVALGYPVDKVEDIAVHGTRSVIDGDDLETMSTKLDAIVLA